MALKSKRPLTPGQRHAVLQTFDELSGSAPQKSLLEPKKQRAGRNSSGRITIRHRGGGSRRKYRVVDYKRDKPGVPAKVSAIAYDPNRSARLALLTYADGEKRYILAVEGMRVGMSVVSGPEAEPLPGNALALERVPLGTMVHNIELEPGRGGILVRSAGMQAQLMARDGNYAHVRMPSGEMRMVHVKCACTVGQVGNLEHEGISLGKAGRKRWMGIRPTVRGVAMNPIDHPMGGGEGRTSGGGHPRSPWGKLAKGQKTRGRRKPSGKFIVKRRR